MDAVFLLIGVSFFALSALLVTRGFDRVRS
jgi:hypothetical protein